MKINKAQTNRNNFVENKKLQFYDNYFLNFDFDVFRYDVGSFCTRKIILSQITHKSGKILEIGTGISSLLFDINNFDLYGIDISQKTIDFVNSIMKKQNKKAKLIATDAENIPFESNFFDVIISSHTLEHIKNDSNVIKECSRVLKPGGELIIFVPGRISGKSTPKEIEKFGHYRYYNSSRFRELEKKVLPDLKIQKILYPHKIHNLIWNRGKNLIRWINYPIKKWILRDNKTYEIRKTYKNFILPIISRSLDWLDGFTMHTEKTLLGIEFNVICCFKKATNDHNKNIINRQNTIFNHTH